jgi:hypothetical protein
MGSTHVRRRGARSSFPWAALSALLAAGCSNPPEEGDDDGGRRDVRDDGDGGGAEPGDGDAVRDDAPVDYVYDFVCDESDIASHHRTVRLMLLLDQSSSMEGSKWADATAALEDLLGNPAFVDLHFGLDAFPDGYPGSWSDCFSRPLPCMSCRDDECGFLFPPQVALAPQPDSAPPIIEHMRDPQYPQFCTFTPLVNQMGYYDTGEGETAAPELYRPDGDNYLVVISDGEDEGCFDGDAVGALASHTTSIRETHGIRSFAIGFGSASGGMPAQLNAIAANGGTEFTTFLPATDGPALAEALERIAASVVTCTWVIDDVAPSADPTQVNFYVGDDPIPMDEDCTADAGHGWHWVDAEHTTVEFCGDVCEGIRDGTLGTIHATFGCPTVII